MNKDGPFEPLNMDFYDAMFPTSPGYPANHKTNAIWRFTDAAIDAYDGKAFTFVITARDAVTKQRVGVGNTLEEVRAKYAGLKCGVANEGAEWPEIPYCTGRVAPGRHIWFGAIRCAAWACRASRCSDRARRRPRPRRRRHHDHQRGALARPASGALATIRSAPSSGPGTAPRTAGRPRAPRLPGADRAAGGGVDGDRRQSHRAARVDRPRVGIAAATSRPSTNPSTKVTRPASRASEHHLTRKVSTASRSRCWSKSASGARTKKS